jgi:hypothetical protein
MRNNPPQKMEQYKTKHLLLNFNNNWEPLRIVGKGRQKPHSHPNIGGGLQ